MCFNGGNTEIASVKTKTKEESIPLLQKYCSVILDTNGYEKVGDIMYCIAEKYESIQY